MNPRQITDNSTINNVPVLNGLEAEVETKFSDKNLISKSSPIISIMKINVLISGMTPTLHHAHRCTTSTRILREKACSLRHLTLSQRERMLSLHPTLRGKATMHLHPQTD